MSPGGEVSSEGSVFPLRVGMRGPLGSSEPQRAVVFWGAPPPPPQP
jgi:hypothetical protein